MNCGGPRTNTYTIKGATKKELEIKIKDALTRGDRLEKKGSTKLNPERNMFWAKMILSE
jgi:hypothetical protein